MIQLPITPTVPDSEFVDREQIIKELYENAMLTKRRIPRSIVLIGLRRFGKTAVLERLYNKIFMEQDEVVPIYINLDKIPYEEADFASKYFNTFLKQYIAFKRKDIKLVEGDISIREAKEFAQEDKDTALLDVIDTYQYQVKNSLDFLLTAIEAPRRVADRNDGSICVIIDEFQNIMKVVSKNNRIIDLRGYYQWSVESRRCPYVVSGSAVSLIFREIISKGPLLGRFSPRYVEGLEEKYVIELCEKLGALLNLKVPEELAVYLHQYTAGCPYYIKQFLQTSSSMLRESKEKALTREVLGNAITYELTAGQVWHDLEEQITSYFSLNEWGIVRTLLFLATKFEDTFDIAYLAKEVNISETEVREILSRLARADLISDDFGVFRNVQDPVLLRFLEIQYRLEIEGFRAHKRELMDKEYRKQIRLLKSKIGILFEYKLRELMRNWDDREVDGALFNTKEKIKLQKFDYVKEEWIKVQGSKLHQIDAYGSTVYPDATQAVWLVESKCQKNPIGTSEVKKFKEACNAALKRFEPTNAFKWFFSVSGFKKDAINEMQKDGIYFSSKPELNKLLEIFGMKKVE